MENNNKIAQSQTNDVHEVTTESQLNSVKGLGRRQGEAPTGTTESKEQLGSGKVYFKDVNSESPTAHRGSYDEKTNPYLLMS